MAKQERQALTDEEIREQMLAFFYGRYRSSTSMKKQQVGIAELKAEMKKRHGLSQADVTSQLLYLMEQGWVVEVRTPRTFKTGGTLRSQDQVTYRIAKPGIDRYSEPSSFQRGSAYEGINIQSVQNFGGTMVIGNRNVVRAEHATLATLLDELRDEVVASNASDQDKVDAAAEIETIQLQLRKSKPDGSIVGRSWAALKTLPIVNAAVQLSSRIEPLIMALS